MRHLVAGQVVALHVDETTDPNMRYVFTILCSLLDNSSNHQALAAPLLLTSIELTAVNHKTVADAITGVVEEYGIFSKDVYAVVGDNASYMKKAWKDILCNVYRNGTFISCYAHIYALAGEEWRAKFGKVDDLVAGMKAIMVKAPGRRGRYLRFLDQNEVRDATLPPSPVVTRWNTWFEAVKYHSKYIDHYLAFIEQEIVEEKKTVQLSKLQKPLSENDGELKIQVTELATQSRKLVVLLDSFQSRSRQGHKIFNSVHDTLTWLQGVAEDGSLSPTTRSAASASANKLSHYHTGGSKQLAVNFFSYLRCLDPIQLCVAESRAYSDIKVALHLPDGCDGEWPIYMAAVRDLRASTSVNICDFWKSLAERLPTLSRHALRLLNIPINSADVERVFSVLGDIMTPSRQSLSFRSMASHLQIAVNYESLRK